MGCKKKNTQDFDCWMSNCKRCNQSHSVASFPLKHSCFIRRIGFPTLTKGFPWPLEPNHKTLVYTRTLEKNHDIGYAFFWLSPTSISEPVPNPSLSSFFVRSLPPHPHLVHLSLLKNKMCLLPPFCLGVIFYSQNGDLNLLRILCSKIKQFILEMELN